MCRALRSSPSARAIVASASCAAGGWVKTLATKVGAAGAGAVLGWRTYQTPPATAAMRASTATPASAPRTTGWRNHGVGLAGSVCPAAPVAVAALPAEAAPAGFFLRKGTTFAPLPARFEAGTPAIGQAVALGAAIDYVTRLGLERIRAHETELLDYALRRLSAVAPLSLIGTAANRTSVISFVIEGVHPHDIAHVLDTSGVAIRAGHHCAQPVMARFGVPATARASFGLYNTLGEVDALAEALEMVEALFIQ